MWAQGRSGCELGRALVAPGGADPCPGRVNAPRAPQLSLLWHRDIERLIMASVLLAPLSPAGPSPGAYLLWNMVCREIKAQLIKG